jgi:phosphate transport system permease protein
MELRRAEEGVFKILMIFSIIVVMTSLLGIIAIIVFKGFSAINLGMIINTPKQGYYLGGGGGIANAIVGSLYLGLGGLLISTIISIPLAFALQKEYLNKKFARGTRLVLDVLWGTPSIVYGAFIFVIMQYLGIRTSLLGGIIVLGILMMPIMTRASEEIIKTIPRELKEASYAMGATRFETSYKVVLKQALPGIITATLVALGRGIGDAASVMFTAGYSDRIPSSLLDPVASLPLAVFFQLGTPVLEVQQRAYASALILLVIVLSISITSRFLSRKFSKYRIS